MLSVPVGCPSHVKRTGIGLYKSVSVRRSLFKRTLTLATFLGCDAFLGTKSSTPVPGYPNFPFKDFMEIVCQQLGQVDIQGIVSFPSDLSRGRFYVNFLSSRAAQLGFAKVSLSPMTDSCFERESEAIGKMAALANRSFHVPKVLAEGRFCSHRYLVLESLPAKAQPATDKWDGSPQLCRNELSEGTYRIRKIEELSWWAKFQEVRSEVTPLAEESESWADRTVQVCLAHGDFTRANMCQYNSSLWLYDWEDTAPDAPAMTDEVQFFLERRPRWLLSRPAHVATLLGRRFLSGFDNEARKNLAMALAFLCSRGNGSGIIMGKQWHRITGNQSKV